MKNIDYVVHCVCIDDTVRYEACLTCPHKDESKTVFDDYCKLIADK